MVRQELPVSDGYSLYGRSAGPVHLLHDDDDDGVAESGRRSSRIDDKSLVVRDLCTHFRIGCTGQSTVRRTFAALLRDTLGLRGIPRNQQNPERPAHFALSAEHDASLNQWTNTSLDLAVWTKPEDCSNLGAIEVGVFARWSPPLNVRDNTSPWRKRVSAAKGHGHRRAHVGRRTWSPDLPGSIVRLGESSPRSAHTDDLAGERRGRARALMVADDRPGPGAVRGVPARRT